MKKSKKDIAVAKKIQMLIYRKSSKKCVIVHSFEKYADFCTLQNNRFYKEDKSSELLEPLKQTYVFKILFEIQ